MGNLSVVLGSVSEAKSKCASADINYENAVAALSERKKKWLVNNNLYWRASLSLLVSEKAELAREKAGLEKHLAQEKTANQKLMDEGSNFSDAMAELERQKYAAQKIAGLQEETITLQRELLAARDKEIRELRAVVNATIQVDPDIRIKAGAKPGEVKED